MKRGKLTYDQVAEDDLQDLSLQASPSRKDLLQYLDQEVTQRRADEGAIDRHLRHSRVDVVAVLALVSGDVGGQHFLKGGECAGCEHLCTKRVGLQLAEVGLNVESQSECYCWAENEELTAR